MIIYCNKLLVNIWLDFNILSCLLFQYEMMKAGNFLYDSTMSALYSDTPFWPYTLVSWN